MIIDAHMHVGVWDHPGFLGRQCDMSDVIDVLAAAGVDGAAVLPTDQCDNATLLEQTRGVIGDGFAGPLWFFAWARPVGEESQGGIDLAWIDANIDSITGIKIHPSLSRERVTASCFAPALELAEAQELVVLVHCGRWQDIASYRFAVEAAAQYPRARFLLAHAGGDTPTLATAAAELVASEGVDNVWFEFSGLREYWVIERNVAKLGAERYLMGSDYCLAHPLMYVGAVRGMNLTDSEKALILGGNAMALFGDPVAP